MRKSGVVVRYPGAGGERQHGHQWATRTSVAKKLAALKGYDYAEEYDPAMRHDGPVYFVPDDTLTSDEARGLGIRTEEDLFGGVVPYSFAATKTITHPLVEEDAVAPQGWSHQVA